MRAIIMASGVEVFPKRTGLCERLKLSRLLGVFPAGIIFLSAGLLQAQLIDVDFNNNSYGGSGPNPGPTMSGAAVLGTAGDQWNGINVNSGAGIPLINADGSASTVTMTFTSDGGYDVNNYGSTPFAGTPYDALMEDYLYNGGVSQTITLSGLATNSTYNLVLYNAADNGAAGRTTYFTVNANTQSSTWDGASSSLIAGVDYVEFTSVLPDGSGNLVVTYTGDGTTEGDIDGFQIQLIPKPPVIQTNMGAAYAWTTPAGYAGTGSADGVGNTAQFNYPNGIATDQAGNIYVADSGNNTIRKITSAGLVTTIAGLAGTSGSTDGMNSAARFYFPTAIAADTNGNLYVTDWGNYTIRKIAPNGTNWVVTTIAGLAGNEGSADGVGTNASFGGANQGDNQGGMQGITVDTAGNVYVADTYNDTIRRITPIGTNWLVTTIAGQVGNRNAGFGFACGMSADSAGNIYVVDNYHNALYQIAPSSTNWVVNTIGSFSLPNGVAVDRVHNIIYVCDSTLTIQKMTPNGANWVTTTLAGSGYDTSVDGTGANASFSGPISLAVDSAGSVYVTDQNEIRKITPAGVVSTLAGVTGGNGNANGTGSSARFNFPNSVIVDGSGNLYVADTYNDTIRQITSAGVVTTMAGLATNSGSADGTGNNARFNNPDAVALDSGGNLYVADSGNNTIRKITSAGVVSTIAGGSVGYADGVGNAAQFNNPDGIVANGNGIFVADSWNRSIRRITSRSHFVPPGSFVTTWTVTTIVGGTFGTADGTGTNAQFLFPTALATDSANNLYVADQGGGIRKIIQVGTNWVVSTIPSAIYSDGIAVDSEGDIYMPDINNDTINKFTPSGASWIVSVIGGLAMNSGSADGAGSAARFNSPQGVAVDNTGNVYVADCANDTIRKGVFIAYAGANTSVSGVSGTNGTLSVTLVPAAAGGQWRFGWEQNWRGSGTSAGNLVAGNYPVEFRSVPGWLVVQTTTNFTVAVTNGGTTYLTNQYYPTIGTVDTNSGGSLTVNLATSPAQPPGGAGWQFLGDTTYYPSGYSTNLVAGTYLIGFAPVAGFSKPANLAVSVSAGLPTVLTESYPVAATAPQNVLLPFPVPANEISDVTDYPFGFNGQLQSDVGYGSGVAVSAKVVLSAAHLVFNDETLSYVSQTYWYFQEETNESATAPPQVAQGWLVLSGYASQRTNDLEGLGGQTYGPDESSPQSRDLDVAALYFSAPVAGGGYGGYLPSDASPNPWLSGNSLKMVVGYPVDGSLFGANIMPGVMYQTQPQPYAMDPDVEPEVYTASWVLSYPGNSGGPVYVEFNGYYYPAGVYLGIINNGSYESAVRAIDSDVVNLITNAEALADYGSNHTGGGVITIIPSQAVSASNPGYLQFLLGPPAAVLAGAGWKLQGDTAYSSATNYIRAVLSTNSFTVLFKPINGWNVPLSQPVSVEPGEITTITNALYTVNNPVLVANHLGIGITGTTGTVYRIERSSSLTSGTWLPVSTNTITTTGFNIVLPYTTTNSPAAFYRALWLP